MALLSRRRHREGLRIVPTAAVVAWIAWSVVSNVHAARRYAEQSPDIVASYTRRIAAVASELPATGIIGYLSVEGPGRTKTDAASLMRYYLAQYALAPRVLVPRLSPEVVLLNHPPGTPPPRRIANRRVRTVGDGLWLLESD